MSYGSEVIIWQSGYTGKARLYCSLSVSYPSDTQATVSWYSSIEMYNRTSERYSITDAGGNSRSGVSDVYPGSGQWFTWASWSGSFSVTRTSSDQTISRSTSGSVAGYTCGTASASVTVAKIPNVTLTASSESSTKGSVSPTSSTQRTGSSFTVTATANSGYTFSKWSNGDTANPLTKTLTSNLSLMAYFTANNYTITFKNGVETVSRKSVTYNEQIGFMPIPTKQHYNFTGWKDTDNVTYTATSIYDKASDATFNAQWSPVYIPPQFITCSAVRGIRTSTQDDHERDVTFNLSWTNGSYAGETFYPTSIICKYSTNQGSTWTTAFSVMSGLSGLSSYSRTITDTFDIGTYYTVQYTLSDSHGTTIIYSDFISKTPYIWRLNSAHTLFGIGHDTEVDGTIDAFGFGRRLLDAMYPVGHIIHNADDNFNPNTLYSWMTWERLNGYYLYSPKKVLTNLTNTNWTMVNIPSDGTKWPARTTDTSRTNTVSKTYTINFMSGDDPMVESLLEIEFSDTFKLHDSETGQSNVHEYAITYRGITIRGQTWNATIYDHQEGFTPFWGGGGIYKSIRIKGGADVTNRELMDFLLENATMTSGELGYDYSLGSTIEAGLPNIVGQIDGNWTASGLGSSASNVIGTGALRASVLQTTNKYAYSGGSYFGSKINMNASDSNSIYGNSDTVRPESFVANIWRRIS